MIYKVFCAIGYEIYKLFNIEIKLNLFQAFNITFAKALQIISDWVLRKVDDRELSYQKLISCLQWNKLDQNDVFKHLEMCNLYNKSEICLYYFLNSIMEYNLMIPNFTNKYDLLHAKYQQVCFI